MLRISLVKIEADGGEGRQLVLTGLFCSLLLLDSIAQV